MKRMALICVSIFILTNLLYPQDIINETGKDGKFIVRDNEEKEVMVIDEGDVSITGAIKVEGLEEGSNSDKVVVWDKDDKQFKAVDQVFNKVSPLSEPLEPKSWHSLGYTGVDEEGNEIDKNVNAPNAVTWNQFDTDYGYIKLGPANATGYAHIYTDRDKFMFDKPFYSKTGVIGGFGDLIFNTGVIERMRFVKATGNFGVGTTDPKAKFHVKGDDGFLVQGTYGSGTTVNLGVGTRMHFYPLKAAFRAGLIDEGIDGTYWDDVNIGHGSVAMGYNTKANGINSTAFGLGTIASGGSSTALGGRTTASGFLSTSMGSNTTASGSFSTAMGYYTSTNSYASVVIGRYNVGGGYANVWEDTDPIFEIGNGSETNFKNALTVLKDGNVGIGTHTPDFPLHITRHLKPWGGGYAHHIKLEVPGGWWTIGVDDYNTDADLLFRSSEDTDGFTAYIDPESGNMAITSDERYKKNIEPVTNVLEKIDLLEPVSYLRLKQDDTERKELGFIAQDVNDIFPDYKVAKKKNEYWSLFYDNFSTIAIAGIKELKKEKDEEIEALKEQNVKLRERLSAIEEKLKL